MMRLVHPQLKHVTSGDQFQIEDSLPFGSSGELHWTVGYGVSLWDI